MSHKPVIRNCYFPDHQYYHVILNFSNKAGYCRNVFLGIVYACVLLLIQYKNKMKIRILTTALIVITFLSLGCVDASISKANREMKSPLYKLKSKFKYHDLKTFETDTFSFDTRPGNYSEVDSATFKLIFQEGDREFIGKGYDRDYYYSWQNRDTNFIEFTILTQDESSYCDLLRYYIFDKSGRFISKFDIATNCGDAGWTFNGVGKQLDKNKFFYQTVESEIKDGSMPEEEKYDGDSINHLITIGQTGKITQRETYKKHSSDK